MPKKKPEIDEGLPVTNGFPMWAKLSIWLGFPAIIAFILLGVIIGYIPSTLTVLAKTTEQLERSMADHRQDTATLANSIAVNIRLQRAICRNTSKTDLERLECDR